MKVIYFCLLLILGALLFANNVDCNIDSEGGISISGENITVNIKNICCHSTNTTCPPKPEAGNCPIEINDFPSCLTAQNCMVSCFWPVNPYNSVFCIKCGGDGQCRPDDQCPPPGICNPVTRICEQPSSSSSSSTYE